MLDYVDLLLIHTPHACKSLTDIATTWEGMNKAVGLGMVKVRDDMLFASLTDAPRNAHPRPPRPSEYPTSTELCCGGSAPRRP